MLFYLTIEHTNEMNKVYQNVEHLEEKLKNEKIEKKRLEGLLLNLNKKNKKRIDNLVKQNELLMKKNKEITIKYQKTAFLTFDDGPSKNTERILDILNKHKVKATFFPIGNNSEYAKSIYKRIVSEGHSLANHTYTHNYSYIYGSVSNFKSDFERAQILFEETTGFRPHIFRFPGGSNNTVSYRYGGRSMMNKIIKEMTDQGYVYFDWNVDSLDASVMKKPSKQIISSVLAQAKGKKTINVLFHDSAIKTTTVDALPAVIKGLKKQGFVFEQLDPTSPTFQFKK